MIDVRELYIGCTYEYSNKVKTLSREEIADVLNLNIEDLIEPIALTPEILEQWCGFQRINKPTLRYELFITDEETLEYTIANSIVCLYNINGDIVFNLLHIKYLHQLQNLTLALTGEQLKVEVPQEKGRILPMDNSSNNIV